MPADMYVRERGEEHLSVKQARLKDRSSAKLEGDDGLLSLVLSLRVEEWVYQVDNKPWDVLCSCTAGGEPM